MIDARLKQQLTAVFRRQRRLRLAFRLALSWCALAVLGLVIILLKRHYVPPSPAWISVLITLGVIAGIVVLVRHRRAQPDWPGIARRIEMRHPELNGLLLTAVQQQPANNGQLHYLQERIVSDALRHSWSNSWVATIPRWRAAAAQLAHLLALLFFVWVLALFHTPGNRKSIFGGGWTADGVTITPGDTSIERGERLVVVASFEGPVPANVNLVATSPSALPKRMPLVKSLSDPVFGGSISEVTTDFVYRVEYRDRHTRDFTVKVFELPRLERADADLTFPDYTGLVPKRVENTHRVSAVEGTRCNLTLQLNKPVARAQFVVKGATSNTIPLVVLSNRPVATLSGLAFETNLTYLLQLVDAEGRTNKLSAQFVVDVLKNREPELKIASPRGDTRPSALEEVSFEGSVWDDFGVQAYGLAYTEAGNETKFVELGRAVPANGKRTFKHLLHLEDLGAKPDQFISWFLWADDIGPNGQVRRSAGDMYFAEVRPFDEIFRQGQDQGGGDQQQQAGGESGGRQAQLAELQKQIINATWKLQRQQSRQSLTPKPTKPATTDQSGSPSPQPSPSGRGRPMAPRWKIPSAQESSRAELRFPLSLSERAGPPSAGFAKEGVRRNEPTALPVFTSLSLVRSALGQRAPGDPSDPPLLPLPERAGRGEGERGSSPLARTREKLSSISGTNKTQSASQFVEDLGVVRDAVAQAISQAETARERQSGARDSALWDDLIRDMEKAQAALEKAAKSPPSLADALAAEQSAFQVLLRLQQREYEVSRNRHRQSGGSSRGQQMQRQLEQLDLTQPENRYENERLAQSPQSAERREQLQLMNRLSELARRQQDLNDRLKELQTALQEARTEQEREEIRRQLKRLQEEEQRMLADVDELQQRMNRPENQSRMSEQRQQLDQTRQEMERTAEAAQQGAASQALASGTRAQRQLQQMRENMRKQNSSEFAEDLKQLRAEAREAERRQQEIQKQMDSFSGGGQKALDDSQERQKSLEQLAQLAQRLTNLVNRATQLSQQTEEAEPLASRELYDALRKFSQDDANSVRRVQDELIERGLIRTGLYQRLAEIEKRDGVRSVELTSEMLRQGFLPQARQASDRAGSAVRELKRGIERAAEKVLGDDAEALRLAQQQLDQLTEQIEREIAQGQGAATTNRQTQGNSGRPQQAQGEPQRGNGERSANVQPAEAGNQNQQPAAGESPQRAGESQPTESAEAAQGGSPQPGLTASAQNRPGNRGLRDGGPRSGDNDIGRLPAGFEQFFDTGRGGAREDQVITGEHFVPWSDRLREVEEMVEDASLQNQLAAARERARVMRQEYKRTGEKPEWAVVRSQVVKPLVEVRNQIAEELARRGSPENLVPIDRDPVPNRFSELVKRYYEELGKEK